MQLAVLGTVLYCPDSLYLGIIIFTRVKGAETYWGGSCFSGALA